MAGVVNPSLLLRVKGDSGSQGHMCWQVIVYSAPYRASGTCSLGVLKSSIQLCVSILGWKSRYSIRVCANTGLTYCQTVRVNLAPFFVSTHYLYLYFFSRQSCMWLGAGCDVITSSKSSVNGRVTCLKSQAHFYWWNSTYIASAKQSVSFQRECILQGQ